MNNQEIKQKLEDIIKQEDKHFYEDAPMSNACGIDIDIVKEYLVQAFNLGVTLSAENAKCERNDTLKIMLDVDKNSILKLLIK